MPTKLLLGSLQVDWTGESFSPGDVIAFAERKHNEAIVACFALRTLSCSTFEIDANVLNGIITLQYFLVAPVVVQETGLFLQTVGRSMSVEVAFESEGYRVFAGLHGVRTALSLAMSPTLSRDDLRQIESSAAERRQLRLAAKRFSGTLLELPGVDQPTAFFMEKVPRYLPSGSRARIVARVKSMPRAQAMLTQIELKGCDQLPGPGFCLPSEMQLHRRIHADFAMVGSALLHAQDHGLPVTLDVVVLFAWADGLELILDLECIVTETETAA
jgi:hypothetical protein